MSHTEIENLMQEVRTDKVQIRLKAFNKLYDILNSRLSEVQKMFKRSEDISWEDLFKAVHCGITNHSRKLNMTSTELNQNDSKITNYSRLILKICESPPNGEFSCAHLLIQIHLC